MAKDLIAFFKVGDQETSAGKEHFGMKDGMLICFIDPNEWDPEIIEETTAIFFAAKVPFAWKADLVDGCLANEKVETANPLTFRARKKMVTFSEIETATGITNLETELRGKNSVPIVDLTAESSTLLKDSTTLNPAALDVNAITAGAANIGSGEVYLTLAQAIADIGNLTANLTLIITSDITETAAATATEDLGGFTLRITSSMPHNGDPTKGWTITWNHDATDVSNQMEGAGIVEFDSFSVVATATVNADTHKFFGTDTVTVAHTFKIHDIFPDISGATLGQFADLGDDTTVIQMWNIAGTGGNNAFVKRRNGNGNDFLENITVIDAAWNGISMLNAGGTVQNCVVTGSGNDDFADIGSATGINNRDADGTAADVNWDTAANNGTVTAANEFMSQSMASKNFARAKTGGTLDSGGVAVSIGDNTTGIRGNARPGGDTAYSIGADEFSIANLRRRMEES